MTETYTTPDYRPTNCREKLRDEGKPYPKSGCRACGASISNRLSCRYAETAPNDILGYRYAETAPNDTPTTYTQADLDRAAQEARAVALEEAVRAAFFHHLGRDCECSQRQIRAILALLDTPAAEALERVRAEEREQIAAILDAKAAAYEKAHNMAGDWEHAVKTAAAQTAKELRHQAAAIRVRGETKKTLGD